jgi:hypothetical protein
MWQQRFSPDGARIAAVVSPEFGKWTLAVDDQPWPCLFSDMVLPPVFSPDGGRVAAITKEGNRWSLAVDGVPVSGDFDMVWDPVFSPCGQHVVAKVELDGEQLILADGKMRDRSFERLWDPVFSPDGSHLLLRYVEDDKYCRHVVPSGELLG